MSRGPFELGQCCHSTILMPNLVGLDLAKEESD
jgi:hypothetical protein